MALTNLDDGSVICSASLDGASIPDFSPTLATESVNHFDSVNIFEPVLYQWLTILQGSSTILDHANDFKKLKIWIKRKTKKGQASPLGVITIPKFAILSPWEGWASIRPSVSDTGKLRSDM